MCFNRNLRYRDGDDYIIEFKALVLELILNVDIAVATTF